MIYSAFELEFYTYMRNCFALGVNDINESIKRIRTVAGKLALANDRVCLEAYRCSIALCNNIDFFEAELFHRLSIEKQFGQPYQSLVTA